MKLEVGGIFLVTSGEYSDYSVTGHFRALRGFDTTKAIAIFRSSNQAAWAGDSKVPSFFAWLQRGGFIEEIDTIEEWHTGCHGELKG